MAKKKLYQMIMDDIIAQIQESDFPPDKPICTEKEICEKYSVSRITAIRAIEELRQRGILYSKKGVGSFVQKGWLSKESLDGHPEILLENKIPDNEKKIVAFILPFDISNGGIFGTIQTLGNILSQNNMYLTINITDSNVEKEKAVIQQLWDQSVSAIVYYPASNNIHVKEFIPFIIKSIPVIVIDMSHDCRFMYNVVSDNTHGQHMLTQHLINNGHKNIAYLSEKKIELMPSVRDRFYGYASTLAQNGIPLNANFVNANTSRSKDKLKKIIKDLVERGVTAIEAEHDELAFNIFLSCQSLNLHVPEDISIVGFDDSQYATWFDVSMTTIKQDFISIGQKVGEIIVSHFQETPVAEYKHIIPVELIVRNSTAKVANDITI